MAEVRKTKVQLTQELQSLRQLVSRLKASEAELRRANEALRESEERYRALMDLSPDAIRVTREGEIVYVNPAGAKLYGATTAEELVGRSVMDFVHPDYRAKVLERRRQVGERRQPVGLFESKALRLDGQVIDVEGLGAPITYQGKPANLVVVRDITERKKAEEALRESEERYRALVDLTPDAIRVASEGEIVYVNPAGGRLYGATTAEELVGRSVMDFVHPDYRAKVLERRRQVEERRQPVGLFESKALRLDGQVIDVEGLGAPITYQGKPANLVVVRDITERKKAEEALRESEQRLRNTLDNMLEGCQIIDYDWRYLYVNDAVAAHGRTTKQALLGKTMMQAYPGIDEMEMFAVLRRCMEERIPAHMENEFTFPDGEKGWFELSIQPIPEGISILSVDITERKQAEKELQESEERYRAIAENSADGIAINVGTTRTYVNRAFLEIHGLDDESQAEGKPFDQFIVPEQRQRVVERALAIQQGNESAGIHETQIRRPDGEVRTLQVTVSPITYNGQLAAVSVLRDVTDQKRLQEQLMRADKLAAVGTLVSGVAHEINNPLTVALGRLDMVLRHELDETLRVDLRTVHDETRRAVDIMRNLLSFAREHKPEKTYVSINETLESTLALRAYELRLNNIKVKKDLQPDLPGAMADPSQLKQIWLNMILNAEQALVEAQSGGTLYLQTRQVGGDIQVTIADDGPGIPAQNISKIFDPFFTTKPVGIGTGLGLSICYGIVQEHGGNIYVASNVGEGTTFTVELPIIPLDPTVGP